MQDYIAEAKEFIKEAEWEFEDSLAKSDWQKKCRQNFKKLI